MSWSIQVKNDSLRVLVANFKDLTDTRYLAEPMKNALLIMRNEAQKFPPQPSRTRSRHFNTWVREVGALPRSAFGFSGKTGRVNIKRAGRQVLRRSEMLMKNWRSAHPQVRASRGAIFGRLVNRVSYAGWVQGEKQVRFHRATGWKTVKQMATKNERLIVALFDAAIRKKIDSL